MTDEKTRSRQISWKTKYKKAADYSFAFEKNALMLAEKLYGKEKAGIFRQSLNIAKKSIPNDASDEEKYENEFANFVAFEREKFRFFRNEGGDNGLRDLEKSEIAFYKQKFSALAMVMKLIRMLSPRTAFQVSVKGGIEESQWMNPSFIRELDGDRAVIEIPRCKFIEEENTDDICIIGCQGIHAKANAVTFSLDTKYRVNGKACTAEITRIT